MLRSDTQSQLQKAELIPWQTLNGVEIWHVYNTGRVGGGMYGVVQEGVCVWGGGWDTPGPSRLTGAAYIILLAVVYEGSPNKNRSSPVSFP